MKSVCLTIFLHKLQVPHCSTGRCSWFYAATIVRLHWWKWYNKSYEINIAPNMEGLSLEGCVWCSLKLDLGMSSSVVCQENLLDFRTGALRWLYRGQPYRLYPALPLLSLRTWAGRMPGEAFQNLETNACLFQACRLEHLQPLLSLVLPHGWVSCSAYPSALSPSGLIWPIMPSLSSPGVPSDSGRFFSVPVS